jgi:hypothetical protein
MPENAFVTVERFPDAIAAELARAKLESAGIGAYLADDLTVSIDWQLTTAIGGIRLQVPHEQASEARAVLRESPLLVSSTETESAAVTPLNQGEKLAERAAMCALLGLLLPPLLLYGAWLALVVSGRNEPMRKSSRWQFTFGVVIIVSWLAVMILVLAAIFLANR